MASTLIRFLRISTPDLKRMRRECRLSTWANDQEQFALRQVIEAITSELQARTMRRWNLVILAVAVARWWSGY